MIIGLTAVVNRSRVLPELMILAGTQHSKSAAQRSALPAPNAVRGRERKPVGRGAKRVGYMRWLGALRILFGIVIWIHIGCGPSEYSARDNTPVQRADDDNSRFERSLLITIPTVTIVGVLKDSSRTLSYRCYFVEWQLLPPSLAIPVQSSGHLH